MNKQALRALVDLALNGEEEDTSSILNIERGQAVIIRTVTHYYTGKIVGVDGKFISLADAAWVADTGRWSEALAKGTFREVEPFPSGCLVAIGAIVDISPWNHNLPKTAK